MTPLGRYIVETVVTLLLVSGLALVVLYAARRGGMGRPLGPLTLAGRLMLDARRAIYLVRVGETYYVIGASEAGLTKLGEMPSDALPAAMELGASPPRAFKDFLTALGAGQPGAGASGPKAPGAPRAP